MGHRLPIGGVGEKGAPERGSIAEKVETLLGGLDALLNEHAS